MKLKYFLMFIFTFLFVIPNVYASRCSRSDILRVRGEANSVVIDRELSQEEVGKFNIIIKGITEDVYIHEELTDEMYTIDDAVDGVITINSVEGNYYVFKLYYFICDSELLRTIKLRLPKYNSFSESSICEGLTDKIEVCNSWYQGELSDEIVNNAVEEYKNNNQNKDENKVLGFANIFFNFLKDNYFYIISVIVVIVFITLFIVFKRKRGALE